MQRVNLLEGLKKIVSESTIQLGAIMEGETPFLVHSIQGF